MIENAERVARYLAGMDRIERICEAAHRLGGRAEDLTPDQPWGDIRGMGNRLRHAYDRIDIDIIWRTAQGRLPELAVEARRALERLSAD